MHLCHSMALKHFKGADCETNHFCLHSAIAPIACIVGICLERIDNMSTPYYTENFLWSKIQDKLLYCNCVIYLNP